MPNFVKAIQSMITELKAEDDNDQMFARKILSIVSRDDVGTVLDAVVDAAPLKKKRVRSGRSPARQLHVWEALFEIGDGATNEQIVEDIRNRQGSGELSKDDATAITQVNSRVSGMKYVRPYRTGGWEIIGAKRSQIRKLKVVSG